MTGTLISVPPSDFPGSFVGVVVLPPVLPEFLDGVVVVVPVSPLLFPLFAGDVAVDPPLALLGPVVGTVGLELPPTLPELYVGKVVFEPLLTAPKLPVDVDAVELSFSPPKAPGRTELPGILAALQETLEEFSGKMPLRGAFKPEVLSELSAVKAASDTELFAGTFTILCIVPAPLPQAVTLTMTVVRISSDIFITLFIILRLSLIIIHRQNKSIISCFYSNADNCFDFAVLAGARSDPATPSPVSRYHSGFIN